jgi:hypothetical protein
MDERRHGGRYIVSFPIRVKWKDGSGKEVVEAPLREILGREGRVHEPSLSAPPPSAGARKAVCNHVG